MASYAFMGMAVTIEAAGIKGFAYYRLEIFVNFYPKIKEINELVKTGYSLIPVGIEIPADTLTPVNAFLRLRATGSTHTFLLESADGGEALGRYSYLGIDPFASLVSKSGELSFQNFMTQEIERQATSFTAVGQYLDRFKMPKLAQFPPGIGGAIGYFGYDCVRYIESLALTEAQGRIRSVKQRLLMSAGSVEILDLSLDEIHSNLPFQADAMLGEERFTAAVQKVKAHIRRGDIFQCVLSDRFRFPVKADSFTIYRILRMINPSPYLFYLGFGDEVLLGSSPEMLMRAQGQVIETCPIAGTRRRGKDFDDDQKMERNLLASVKEGAEHLMLVDLGRNDLGRVAKPGSVKVQSFKQVVRYSHVMHLVSLVSGQLKAGKSSWDAFGACFPAGTLTGAPKIRAMEIISGLEKEARGTYGGAIVSKDFAGDLNSCITIRSLFLRDGFGYAQAGAGIVADSKAAQEYDEVRNKVKVVLTAVALAEAIKEDVL
ncbi:MAG: anthranilate synthase component I family protein [Proteobacteria bacterium]|nr:anthranilate synthase component I family protein [Pseudomonadota bacterium]